MAKKHKQAKAPTPTPAPEPTPEVITPVVEQVVEQDPTNGPDRFNPLPPPPEVTVVKVGETGKRYVSKTDPNSKYHLRDRSDVEKPVGVVKGICNANPDLTRKEIINLCLAAGVNKNTAATQYSLWRAKRNAELRAANAAPGGPVFTKAYDAEGNEIDPNE